MSSRLLQALSDTGPACKGTGRVLNPETIARKIERSVKRVGALRGERTMVVRVHPRVALYIIEKEREILSRLKKNYGLTVTIQDDPLLRVDDFKLLSLPSKRELARG